MKITSEMYPKTSLKAHPQKDAIVEIHMPNVCLECLLRKHFLAYWHEHWETRASVTITLHHIAFAFPSFLSIPFFLSKLPLKITNLNDVPDDLEYMYLTLT